MKLVLVPLILAVLVGGASNSSFAECLTFDSRYPVPKSLLYVSAPNTAGDRLVVAAPNSSTDWFTLTNLLPVPSTPNQQFCGLVDIAPGIRAQVYVPTAQERSGDFSPFAGLVLDPNSSIGSPPNPAAGEVSSGLFPYLGGIIPAAQMGNLFILRVSSVQFTANPSGALTMTSLSSLPAPVAGASYNQQLSVAGGRAPYSWSITKGALPTGLSLDTSQGKISGTPTAAVAPPSLATVRVTDAASATFTLTLTFGLAAPDQKGRVGVFSQVAVGAGWKTTIYLSNPSTSAADTTVTFRGDDGNALSLPMTVSVAGSSQTVNAANADGTIAPNSIMVIEAASDGATPLTGWAEVTSTSALAGYAVFRSIVGTGPSSEGTVPLETSYQTSFSLIYDNTNGQSTAVAVAEVDPGSGNLMIQVFDENGKYVDGTTLGWPAGIYGHGAFLLTGLVPKATGNRGVLVVKHTSIFTNRITGLGLRVSPTGSFSSIPRQATPSQ